MQRLLLFWGRWRWFLFVSAVVLGLLSTGILYKSVWKPMAVVPMTPAFADMEAVLAAGDAWSAGYNPYVPPNLFDSYNRPHIYGPGWLVMSLAGMGVSNLAEVSVGVLAIFLISLGVWYRPMDWRSAIGMLAVFLSPPIMLGIERANNDLLMVALFSFAAVWVGRKGSLTYLMVVVVMAAAAWLKLYPIYALPALFTLGGGMRESLIRAGAWLLLTAAGFALYAGSYARLLGHIPTPETFFAYDARFAFRVCWSGIPGMRLWFGAGGLAALALAALFFRSSWRGLWTALPLTGSWGFLTVGSASIWVGCLCTAPSFPYRAVWLLPLMGWAAGGHAGKGYGGYAATALLRWLIAFMWIWWTQWQVHRLFEQGHWVGVRLWAFVISFAQASVVITTLLLAWLLLGWAWRRAASFGLTGPRTPVE